MPIYIVILLTSLLFYLVAKYALEIDLGKEFGSNGAKVKYEQMFSWRSTYSLRDKIAALWIHSTPAFILTSNSLLIFAAGIFTLTFSIFS